MKRFYFIFLSLIIFNTSFPQYSSKKVVTDFKISTDNLPSTIIQSNPKLFYNGSKRFLVTWEDYRNGEENSYAQWFDSLGNKVGENFKILSNGSISFAKDGSYLGLQEDYFEYSAMDLSGVNVWGRIYYQNNKSSNTFFLGGGSYPWCGTGWLGIDYNVTNFSSGYIFVNSNDGSITFSKYDNLGNQIFYKNLDTIISARSTKICIASNKNDYYILAYHNGGINYFNPKADTLNFGIYASFFSLKDSLMAKDIMIDSTGKIGDDWYSYNAPYMKISIIEDSLFQVFWLYKNSTILNSSIYNSNGVKIGLTQKVYLPNSTLTLNGYRTINNFTFSNLDDNKSALLISMDEIGNGLSKHFNTLLFFDWTGTLVDSQFNNLYLPPLGDLFFNAGDGKLFATIENGGDVYIDEFHNLDSVKSYKITDDLIGSNETNPRSVTYDNNNNFITWDNEINSVGQKIDIDGNLIGNQIELKGNQCIFSSNGKCYNLWKEVVRDDSIRIGYTIYDIDWNIIDENILTVSYNSYYGESSITKISDSLFILYFKNQTQNFVRTLDRDFNSIKEIHWGDTDIMESFRIFKNDDHSFWIASPSDVQLYSTNLYTISEDYRLFFHLYLGNNTFLYTNNNCPYGSYSVCDKYGQIYNTSGDTLIKKFHIASKTDDLRLILFPNNDFLAIWNRDNNLYARAFSNEGIAKTDSFLIHSDIQSFKKQPTVVINGDKVFFAWADARNEGRGYDIYGSIFDLSKIVNVDEQKSGNVPKQFALYQNYPNPFNPSTLISYQLPANSFVVLKVFDILGKEVTTLVNKEQNAGTYEVEFDGSNITSGVYFYQLKSECFIETKKFVLMK
jgi:hypothetical protein